jgi:hypothetical protein
MTAESRTASRWMAPFGCWTWHEWSDEAAAFVDTGIRPLPGRPVAQQRPEGR